MAFKPFCDYFASGCRRASRTRITSSPNTTAPSPTWTPASSASSRALDELGLADNTLVVLNGDHGETLMDHECYFDHHGMYDCTLHVPLIMRYPGRLPAGQRVRVSTLHQDLVPTLLELRTIDTGSQFDGRSLLPLVRGERASN